MTNERWSVVEADAIEWLDSLPADCADLVFGSPPYEKVRTYGIDFKLDGQAWVDWMVSIYKAASRVCKGLVAFVLEGQTKNYRWSAVPALLMADLHRAGLCLRKPPIFQRVGIPGSGGPDWLRNNYEFIVCTTRGGKLPWSDNTALGTAPKYGVGGEMSYRTLNGERVNERKTKILTTTQGGTNKNGAPGDARTVRRKTILPEKVNPGNVIHCAVGGGLIGSLLAHENEAPFPEQLAEFFVRSFCPPDGLVLDCFSGSGTTGAVALRNGRRFQGCDIRQSQVELSRRRIAGETPPLFAH